MDLSALLSDAFGALERSRLGEAVRITPYLYPVLESLHILGIALLVGSVWAVDLRLLGIGRHVLAVTTVTRFLLPLSLVGFALAAATGAAMFAGTAVAVGSSPAAPWKIGLIVLAGLNIAIFHAGVYRSVDEWQLHADPPLRAKLAGLITVSVWTGVIFAGRFLAY